jgi:hypothetical protein
LYVPLFKHSFIKLLGHKSVIIVSHALQTSIFFISSSVIIASVLSIIPFLNNKYFANQISNNLYHRGHLIVVDSKSSGVILIFTHHGSHSGIYRLKELSPFFSIDVIIRVSKYLDLAKFFIATTK